VIIQIMYIIVCNRFSIPTNLPSLTLIVATICTVIILLILSTITQHLLKIRPYGIIADSRGDARYAALTVN
jgi:hypothetical protein